MKLRECLEKRGMTKRSLTKIAFEFGEQLDPTIISLICLGRRHAYAPERARIVKALLALKVPPDEVASIDELRDRPDGRHLRRKHKALG